ncbi:hypothetical protein TI03_06830, partial [Achromatium sp. WMS1]
MATSWRPSASLQVLRARATLLTQIRAFFASNGVMEVETPVCAIGATLDPAIEVFCTKFCGPGYPDGLVMYLQSSPEVHMKRLLAAGSGDIFQICHVFRDGERGRVHNQEFSLLEWYRLNYDHHQLMDEVAMLINTVANKIIPEQRLSYAELFY